MIDTIDIATLDDDALRARVAAWGTGFSAEEREAIARVACAAFAELQIRADVDRQLGRLVRPLPPPPWETPRPPRCQSWQRPRNSTIYNFDLL